MLKLSGLTFRNKSGEDLDLRFEPPGIEKSGEDEEDD